MKYNWISVFLKPNQRPNKNLKMFSKFFFFKNFFIFAKTISLYYINKRFIYI